MRLSLPSPTARDIGTWIHRFERTHDLHLGASRALVTSTLRDVSFAEIEEFFADVQRRLVLDGPGADVTTVVSSRVRQWKARRATRA